MNSPEGRRRFEQYLIGYIIAILLLTTGAWGISLYRYKVLGQSAEASTLLYKPYLRFTDTTLYFSSVRHAFGNGARIEAGPPLLNLAAPGIIPYWLLSLAGDNAIPVYFAGLMAGALACCFLLYGSLRKQGTASWVALTFLTMSVLTSYPMAIEMDRANIEGAVWLCLVVATVCYGRGTEQRVQSALR